MVFKHVLYGGIIDLFAGTLSSEELIKSLVDDNFYEKERAAIEVEKMCGYICGWIERDENESPTIIRFFSTPNYEGMEMNICALAKIQNNGSTYMFTNDDKLYRLYKEK